MMHLKKMSTRYLFEDFDKSFVDPAFSGERATLTVMYQVLKLGLHLVGKTLSLPAPAAKDNREDEKGPKKRKRKMSKREIDMLSK